MSTPHQRTTVVVVLELDDDGAENLERWLAARPPLARYAVRAKDGIDDVLAVTTGWTRNT